MKKLVSLSLVLVLLSSFNLAFATESLPAEDTNNTFSLDIVIDPTVESFSKDVYFTEQGVLDDGTVVMALCDSEVMPHVGDNVTASLFAQKVSGTIYAVTLDLYVPTTSIRSASATVAFGDGFTENKSADSSTLPSCSAKIYYTNHYYSSAGSYRLSLKDYRVVVNDSDDPTTGVTTWVFCSDLTIKVTS